jgi:adenylate cyclase
MASAPAASHHVWARPIRLALATMVATLGLWLTPLAELEDGAGLRLHYTLRGVTPPPERVLIVALDSTSAKALGLPDRPDRWPRGLHARLVSGLAARGAAVVGFDLLFNQPRDPADDRALAESFRQAGNVVLAEGIVREPVRDPSGQVVATAERRNVPLPLLAEAALATAPFVVPKTPDGVFEFWTHVPAAADRPSLPVIMAGVMLAPPRQEALAKTMATQPPALAPNGLLRRALNLYGPLGTVQTIPYGRALELVADPQAGAAAFAGKAVLVGLSESNQSKQVDAYRTPFTTPDGVDVSGVELCATALGNLLDESWLRRPGEPATVLLLALLAGLLALPWGFLRPAAALPLTLALALAYALAAHFAFARAYLWLPLVMPLGFVPATACALGLASHYRDTQRRRARLEQAADLGLSPRAMEQLATMLGTARGGQTVSAVCLCSDIVGYTSLSETLSPEATRNVLNAYFARFVPVVEGHGGYVADTVGDSVMSLWVADTAPEVAFRQACEAALELDLAMNRGTQPGALHTRFGLHCGRIYLGGVGADGHQEFRAVGDIVNTTSRIQGANKYLRTRVLASAAVAAHLEAGMKRPLGHFIVAGKAQPLELLELTREPPPAAALGSFALGVEAFRAGQFAAAAEHFAAARELGDPGPADFYLEQCQRRANLPPDPSWHGAVVLPGK